MLLLTKSPIQLQVHCAATPIRVVPVIHDPEQARLLGTIAKSEELLAGVYLRVVDQNNREDRLVTYFSRRGWQVKILPSMVETTD